MGYVAPLGSGMMLGWPSRPVPIWIIVLIVQLVGMVRLSPATTLVLWATHGASATRSRGRVGDDGSVVLLMWMLMWMLMRVRVGVGVRMRMRRFSARLLGMEGRRMRRYRRMLDARPRSRLRGMEVVLVDVITLVVVVFVVVVVVIAFFFLLLFAVIVVV